MSCALCLVPEYGDEKDREKSEGADNSEQSDVLSPRHVERIVYDKPSASDSTSFAQLVSSTSATCESVDQEGLVENKGVTKK
jgi:hypothetical protein